MRSSSEVSEGVKRIKSWLQASAPMFTHMHTLARTCMDRRAQRGTTCDVDPV